MLKIRIFTKSSQMLLDTAVGCAEALRYNYLGSEHFLYAFLRFDTQMGKKLMKKGITDEYVLKYLAKNLENNPSLRYTGDELKDYITVDNISEELEAIFNVVIDEAKENETMVDWANIVDELFNNENGAFKALLDELFNKVDTILPESLAKFGKNLTEMAYNKELEPVIGREEEIEHMIHVLLRKNKKNPCLIGEAGVGKTALVEGLAQRISDGKVPVRLKNKIIYSLNMASVLAGTRYRGDFEERMNAIINEVEKHKNIIMFIDEIHSLVNSGATSEGGSDAINILKPALARGTLQLIGATTTAEYKKSIERDAAFARRMQSILVDEPSVEDTIAMMRGLCDSYEKFHGVQIEEDALVACVNLSKRYITDRFLPDKAITVCDETAARLSALGKDVVTKADICATIQRTTGINVSDLTTNENKRLANLENELNSKVIGQEEAVAVVSKALKRSRAGLRNPNRPIGSFLFVGPTGVGKTELGKTIATYLNGTDKSLIKLDMSEYMEKHSVSKIIGSPPGYIGFDEGGQLTDKIKRNPYSVIIFDEIEKAHPEVCDILLQILDEGSLTDARGVKVDFKNAVIVITSNIGSSQISSKRASIGFGGISAEEKNKDNKEIVMNAIKAHFRPEFLNRIDNVVVFKALDESSCKVIASHMLDEVSERIKSYDINVSFEDSILDAVVANGFDEKMGARNIKREIQTLVEDNIADAVINEEVLKGEHYTMKIKNEIVSFEKVKEMVTV